MHEDFSIRNCLTGKERERERDIKTELEIKEKSQGRISQEFLGEALH